MTGSTQLVINGCCGAGLALSNAFLSVIVYLVRLQQAHTSHNFQVANLRFVFYP